MDSPQISHCIILLQLDYYHYYYYYYYQHYHHHHHMFVIFSSYSLSSMSFPFYMCVDEKSAFSQPHSFLFGFLSFPHILIHSSIYIYIYIYEYLLASQSGHCTTWGQFMANMMLTGWHTNHLGPCSDRMRSQGGVVLYMQYAPPTRNFNLFRLIYIQFGIVCTGL